MTARWLWGLFASAAVVSAASAQDAPASQGVYTSTQAAQGASLYVERCASCHGSSMGGQDVAPPLAGAAFMRNWTGKPVADLSKRIRTSMPLDAPGTLGLADSARLVAALLEANGYAAGVTDLPSSPSAQQSIVVDGAAPSRPR